MTRFTSPLSPPLGGTALVLLAIFLSPAALAAPHYRLIDLGPKTTAIALNESGEVVGTHFGKAATWLSGTWTKFKRPTLQDDPYPHAINDAGSIAGASHGTSAEVWWPSGRAEFLGVNGPSGTDAVDITDDATVLVQTFDSSQPHAATWKNGVVTLVPDPEFFQFGITVNAMNRHHDIAGSGGNHSTDIMRYSHGVWEDLGGLGDLFAHASDINDSGHVVGGASLPSDGSHACFFNGTTMVDLGTLGGDNSDALAINDQDEIVGNAQDASGLQRAFIYKSGVMSSLATLTFNPRGISLDNAVGINESGQILGNGMLDGVPHAFLLSPLSE